MAGRPVTLVLGSVQMEDGHTLFDYDVRLNDTIQLLVRQSLVLPASSVKERDSELSDTDSGCCLGQSESDKSSNSGEAASEADGKAGLADEDTWDETELGLYKVSLSAGLGLSVRPTRLLSPPPGPRVPCPMPLHHTGFLVARLQGQASCRPSLGRAPPSCCESRRRECSRGFPVETQSDPASLSDP